MTRELLVTQERSSKKIAGGSGAGAGDKPTQIRFRSDSSEDMVNNE